MKSKSIYLCILVLASVLLRAEDGKSPRSFFRTLGVDLSVQDLGFTSEKGFQGITIDEDRRSVSYEVPSGQLELMLGRHEAGPDGQTLFKEVGKVSFPRIGGRWLILFLKQTGSNPAWTTIALPDEFSSVPPGGYRFVNLLGYAAGILMGSDKRILAPHESIVMEPHPAGNQIIFKTQVYKIPDGTPTVVFSNIWSVDREQRHLVLVVPSDEAPSGVSVKRLSEYVNLIPKSPSQ